MGRYDRYHRGSEDSGDQRSNPERDRDRVLYTPHLRRLAGVTQVAGALEGHVFHNRLTHTLKVAQISRRLAENFLSELQQDGVDPYRNRIHPEVAEAAALAHDLGHPPFGHVAEETLNDLARDDGFEGNAQSFRIVAKLAPHRGEYVGLDLTRATLNAILKYPWRIDDAPRFGYDDGQKFGAYNSEGAELTFAREDNPDVEGQQCVEAAIMDHADDIAYSVHDLSDFYRASLVPLTRLRHSGAEFSDLLDDWKRDETAKVDADVIEKHQDRLREHFVAQVPPEPYEGTFDQRRQLNLMTSNLIERYITQAELVPPDHEDAPLRIDDPFRVEMRFWQYLVWHYVIATPRLATQQAGQEKVIRKLYEVYYDAIQSDDKDRLPPKYRFHFDRYVDRARQERHASRLASDIVAGFTDDQAVMMYRRFTGNAIGSITDLLQSV